MIAEKIIFSCHHLFICFHISNSAVCLQISGPGKLASRSGRLSINTESLETFSRVYEVMLVVQKDSKKGKARIGKGRMPKKFQNSSRKLLGMNQSNKWPVYRIE